MNGGVGAFGQNANEKDMLYELHHLFKTLDKEKKTKGYYNHKRFILAVKASNALFDNDEHHDSHEFVNWLLDKVHEDFLKNKSATKASNRTSEKQDAASASTDATAAPQETSFVQEYFMGKLVNVVTCLTCEHTTTREETFNNLSLDIEQNSSLIHCINRYSVRELLNRDNKLMCDSCLTRQVGTKELQVSQYPKLLLVHLKRFKIDYQTF